MLPYAKIAPGDVEIQSVVVGAHMAAKGAISCNEFECAAAQLLSDDGRCAPKVLTREIAARRVAVEKVAWGQAIGDLGSGQFSRSDQVIEDGKVARSRIDEIDVDGALLLPDARPVNSNVGRERITHQPTQLEPCAMAAFSALWVEVDWLPVRLLEQGAW